MGRPSTYSEVVAIYALTDPRDGAIRYIGKANDAGKRLKCHLRDARRRKTPVYAWINKLSRLGMAPGMTVLTECHPEAWMNEERRLIAEHRASGCRLLNVADGGDEPACPLEVRQANGRKAASRRNEVVFWLISNSGRNAAWFAKRGNHKYEAICRETQARLRAMSPEQQERFAEEWKRSGNYWPGRERHGQG